MLMEILKKQLTTFVDKDARDLDKALNLLVIAAYILIVVQLQKYIHILEIIIPSSITLGLSEQILLTLITSILVMAGYFLLLEVADFLRVCASRLINDIQYLFKRIFQIYSESEVERAYKYNRNIVLKYDVERYLEINQDERVKEIYENHNRFVSDLIDRKRDIMAIYVLLAVNFYINHEKLSLISDYVRPYWVITVGLAIWAAFLPYNNITYMYIHNNRIRN